LSGRDELVDLHQFDTHSAKGVLSGSECLGVNEREVRRIFALAASSKVNLSDSDGRFAISERGRLFRFKYLRAQVRGLRLRRGSFPRGGQFSKSTGRRSRLGMGAAGELCSTCTRFLLRRGGERSRSALGSMQRSGVLERLTMVGIVLDWRFWKYYANSFGLCADLMPTK
jgi:hypothetical protein